MQQIVSNIKLSPIYSNNQQVMLNGHRNLFIQTSII